MESHRIAKALRIIPPDGKPEPPLPAPNPVTTGWWIDPADPRYERYHDGLRWTDRTLWITTRRRAQFPLATPPACSPEPGVPDRQGLFPLGAGPDGIPLGGPRAPASAPYPEKSAIWVWVIAFCAGFTLFWAGLRTTGTARTVLIATGAATGLGAIGWLAISAWRGGFRPPGFGPEADPRGRWLGSLWLRALIGGFLIVWLTPALNRDSAAYDWLNRIGVILADSAALQGCLMGLYSSIFMEYDGPPGKEWIQKANIFISLGVGAFMLWVTWDRILDALWIR
jgi:hypothetical protein